MKLSLIPFALALTPGLLGQTPAGNVSPTYKVRTRDVLSIKVAGEPEYSIEAIVLDDGDIDFPLEGPLPVAGKTVSDIRNEIVARVSKMVRSPQASVTIAKLGPMTASAVGALLRPATIDITENSTVLDVISQCGGLALTVRPEWVRGLLVHKGETAIPFDLAALLAGEKGQRNLPVRDGDIVMLTELSPERRQVKVVGEVSKPGPVDVVGDATFASVLASAGGPTKHAAMTHALLSSGAKTKVVDLSTLLTDGMVRNGDGTPDIGEMIHPGDTLIVPTNEIKFSVLGSVHNPGAYDFPDHQPVNLLTALSTAGGQMDTANMRAVKLVRKVDSNTGETTTYDVARMVANGTASSVLLRPGDVLYVQARGDSVGLRDASAWVAPLLYFFRW